MSERKARFSVIKSKDGQPSWEATTDSLQEGLEFFWDNMPQLSEGEQVEFRNNQKDLKIFSVAQGDCRGLSLEQKIDLKNQIAWHQLNNGGSDD